MLTVVVAATGAEGGPGSRARGACTTTGRAGSRTERPSGDVAVDELTRIGAVTSVPSANASTTPLVMETSFGLMEIPLAADTLS